MAVTEAGLMTMRWNRSMWVPSAWATAALIVSACETHTIVPPGCCSAEPVERRHHPGLHLGEALAAGEAERRRCALHRAATRAASSASSVRLPVHSPKSHSNSPRSICVRSPRGLGDRRGRLLAPVRAASCRSRRRASSAAIRSAAMSACWSALVGEVQPRGATGQHLARGGVWPCRTRRTVVAAGCAGFLPVPVPARLVVTFVVAMACLQPTVGFRDSPRAPRRGRRRRAVPAPVSSRGASRWPPRSGRRSATRCTGAGRSPASVTRTHGSSCSAWRRPPTARTAPAGCSPATAAATGCSGRCTGPASPTSRESTSIDDGLAARPMRGSRRR